MHCYFLSFFIISIGWLHSSYCLVQGDDSLFNQLYTLFLGNQTIATLIPSAWLDYISNLPGSGYLIAFIYWLRHPLLLCLLLPFLLIFFIYFTVVFIHLYHLRYWLRRHLNRLLSVIFSETTRTTSETGGHVYLDSIAELLRRVVAAIWDAHGRIFHGYEVIGMEKLPVGGPAYLVYYHGTCPFDAYYFMSRHCIERDRFPVPVVDRFLFRVPGFGRLLEIVGAIEGSVDECVAHLQPGHVLKSNHYLFLIYDVAFFERDLSLPIYPMFTENIREAIRIVQSGK
ncbi:unnamed protein product, partial [Trichobilharzia regenti]